MFTQYFGQYLFNKGIITASQLCDLLAYEQSVRVKLGVLAINAGLMTAAQVEEVHELQRTMHRRFGEIAIDKGFLTQPELDSLLGQQASRHLSLSQAIIDKGYLTLNQLEAALEKFKQETRLSEEQFQALQRADIDQIVRLFLKFPEGESGSLYYDYVTLLLKNIVRFLNERPVLSWPLPITKKTEGWLITQQAIGDITLCSGLVLSDATLVGVASRFSQEDLTQVDEFAKDSVAEFLNLHNGIFLINLSDKGCELDLQPQTIEPNTNFTQHNDYRIPIDLSCGRLEVFISLFL